MTSKPHEPSEYAAEPAAIGDSQRHGDDLNDDDSQYHEVSSTSRVPVKSGEDDGLQADSDRPGSAGTSHSLPIDQEDEEFLANTAASPTKANSSPALRPTDAPLFSRQDRTLEPEVSQGFMFGKPRTQKLDFQGTRTSHTLRTTSQPMHAEAKSASPPADENDKTEPIMSAAYEIQHHGVDLSEAAVAHDRHRGELEDHRSTSPSGAANKSQQPRLAPSSPSDKIAGFGTANLTTITEDEARVHEPSQADHLKLCHEEDARSSASNPGEERGSPSPDLQPAQDYHPEQTASRHGRQLSGFETTEPQLIRSHSTLEEPRYETATQTSVNPSPSPRQTRAIQATREQRGMRSDILHTQFSPAGITKQPKKKKAQTAANNVVTTSEPDPSVWLEIFLFKQREKNQIAANRAKRELGSAMQQLKQLTGMNADLGRQLDSARLEKEDLLSAHQACDVELRKLKEISSKHKRFLDGLGKDLVRVKDQLGDNFDKHSKAVERNRSLQDERKELLKTLNECAESASQQRNAALEVCSEMQVQLQAAVLRADYLDQQLNEKVGLLAEERDRRAQLERRMLSTSDSCDADRAVIKKGHDALLDKLFLIHATLEGNAADGQTSQLLSQIFEAVQTISAQSKTSADDATLTKGLVEALGDRLTELDDHTSSQPLKKQLDDVLTGLQKLADSQEDRVRQDSAHGDAMNGLQEKLTCSNARVTTVEHELVAAKDRENLLMQEIQTLKNRMEAVQSQPSSGGETQMQLEDTQAELQAKAKAIEDANASIASKTAELEALRKTNEDLQTSMQNLRAKIDEQELTMRDQVPQKEAIEQHTRKEIERVRAESLQHHEEFRAQLDMEKRNQLKKLASDRDRYEKQVNSLKAELKASKKRVEEHQQSITQDEVINAQLDQMKKFTHAKSKEIETLKSSLSTLQESADLDASLKVKLADIYSEFDTERALRQEAVKEKAAFLQQANERLKKSIEADNACVEVKAELATCRTSFETEIQKLAVELKEAQEARQRAEAGQEHLKKSCDATLENEADKNRRKEEALQASLAERDVELKKLKDEAVSFTATVEKEYELMDSEHAKQTDDLRNQIKEVEVARDEAVAKEEQSNQECGLLLEQIDALKKRLESTEEETVPKAGQERNSEDGLSLEAPSLRKGITPSASLKSMEPSRPRKKVDRNHVPTIDTSALPAPEVLRPGSQGAANFAIKQASREPVASLSHVEETQFTGLDIDELPKAGVGNFNMFSDDGNVAQATQIPSSQHPTERIEETQIDSLPSFAEFNRTISASQGFELSRASPSLSMSYRNSQEAASGARQLVTQDSQLSSLLQGGAAPAGRQLGASFSIYEDSHEVDDQIAKQLRSHSSSGDLNSNIELSQEELEKYTFRKKMPQPNSGSKIVRADSQTSVNSTRLSGLPQRALLGEQRFKTPEVRGEGIASGGSTAHSSSPAYVQPTSSRPTRTYSTATAGAKPSRTQSSAIQDPRLAGRNPPQLQKRKTSTQVVEGYEHERKKRTSAASAAAMSDAPRSLRSNNQQSQQSIRDVPSFSSLAANSQGSGSQSRLRTFRGGASRASGSRKVTKDAEYGARFSRELD